MGLKVFTVGVLITLLVLAISCSDDPTTPDDPATGTVVIDASPDSLDVPWTLTGPAGYVKTGTGNSPITGRVVGSYTVIWGDVSGWLTPENETLTLVADDTLVFSAAYIAETGTVVIDQTPDILSGAGWSLTGPQAQTGSSDSTLTGMPVGEYTLTWEDVSGYITPSSSPQTLTANEMITFNGTYLESPPEHFVLIESFSNHGVGPGPIAHEAVWEAVAQSNGTVIPLAWHVPWPLGDDPFFMYNLPVGPSFQTARYQDFYNIMTIPNTRVDGESVSTPSSSYEILSLVETALARPRVVDMNVSKTTNETGDMITVNVDGEVVNATAAGPWRLYVILYETQIEYEAVNGQTVFRNIVRHVNGEEIGDLGVDLDLSENSFSRLVIFSPDIDDQYLNVDNLCAMAFVQHQQAPFLVLDTAICSDCEVP